MIVEPVTMATDYVLAIANAYFGWHLLRVSGRPAKFWSSGFLALSAAAAAGGSYHGMRAALDPGIVAVLWQTAEFAIGIGSLCLLLGVAELYASGRWLTGLRVLALAKFLVYMVSIAGSDEYVFAIYDSGVTVAVSIAIALVALRLWHHPSTGWLLAGYGVSILAAFVQLSGLRLSEHFNHNDLYHLIQLIAMTLLFRAGLDFGEAMKRPRRP